MTNYQFHLILALLFFIAGNGSGSDGASMIAYVFCTLSAVAAVAWARLERKP